MIEFLAGDVLFFFICCVLAKYDIIEMEWYVPQWMQNTVQDLPDGGTRWYDDVA